MHSRRYTINVKGHVADLLLLWLTLTACGGSATAADTQVALTQFSADSGPQSELPPVWIISNGAQILGTLAAGGTSKGHFDPSPILPSIAHVDLVANTQEIVLNKPSSIRDFRATIRPWKADGRIIPLEDPSSRELAGQLDISSIRIKLNLSGEHLDQILSL